MAIYKRYLQYTLFSTILLMHINLITSNNDIWQDYFAYDCDLTTSAFQVQYLLNLPECKNTCSTTTSCKGIVWYEYLKQDVPTEPSRCYLLNKICELRSYIASPAYTSFWYKNISLDTDCINYPMLWSDRYADDCNYYSKYRVCNNAFNDSIKTFILTDYDSVYNFNAFQVCCSCDGSIFEYKPHEIRFVLESIWKPSHQFNIIDNMVCQTYNQHITSKKYNLQNKWNINIFLGICNHLTTKAQNKFRNIYSIADTQFENLQSMDYKQLNSFDCINDLFFIDKMITFYVCNDMDHTNFPYIIDIRNDNYTVYLNGYFININDFISNVKNNEIIFENQCNIESLISNNNQSNILGSLLCEFNTDSPTHFPTIEPTKFPTTSEPSFDPTMTPTNAPTFTPTGYPSDSPTPLNIYSDKTQITAFCLTFFFGVFGAGRWYINEQIGASFQLVMFILFGCLMALAVYFYKDYEKENGTVVGWIASCICCGLFIWWIVDLALIGEGQFVDDNGKKLEPW
eukprot:142817_1